MIYGNALNNEASNVWLNYLVMSNELSTPKVLVCPDDIGRLPPCTNFSSQLKGHVSYFIGLDAKRDHPQTILSGDENLAVNGIRVHLGILILSSNDSVKWTQDRHNGYGNLVLANGFVFIDGSSQNTTIHGLQQAFQQTGLATIRLAIP
jgi:hypothetical protein